MAVPRTYHLVTLGCPKNDVDSSHLARLLEGGELLPVADPREADAIIVNTCGFIEQSQAQSMAAVKELAAAKRDGQTLIVAGCMTQLYGREVKEGTPGIDHVFGVGQWHEVAKLLQVDVEAIYDIPESNVRVAGPSAYLKISDGCDAPCTFCVIPKIKGGLRSAPAGLLVKEAQRLAGAGAKELVLVGQDTTAWGEDLGMPVGSGLPGLLRMLSEAVPGTWLRLMYAYPSRVTPELIAAMAELPNVVHYLDVPLQHGSEAVLRRMKRPHNLEKVYRFIEELRAAMPDIVLRTSFIAGFPGETEAEFEELLAFAQAVEFDHAGCFTYSRQQWTGAYGMDGQVPDEVKAERRERFMAMQQAISARRAARFIGRELDLLVEGTGEDEDGRPVVAGRTYREAPEVDGLVFARGRAEPGERVRVRIEDAAEYDLFGRVLNGGGPRRRGRAISP
ncbi:30S ribosomal protein S12 methylthiotransferase RimO [Tepidiforma sp.]|jgi:ribosomal protein S12 methylthiotransferase|uniref:30S ribosomal protein S12 methylthiotransferase RimO n=1 Tax=Tepidiforma sp. TaxID=2682230 RepID=UPI0021DF18A0|nr:30S ribosomal protein S12 methylthiotransferase RimO [Tepidiforma sp.]MCX7618202.1 30S ribosomal protein S12 methylthiotransferase RimO [Tepidiforma sp.]GIW18246.1 MAG: ribosomal protein S12 methylthiotransferase RimO [Tepidiforma sp.]